VTTGSSSEVAVQVLDEKLRKRLRELQQRFLKVTEEGRRNVGMTTARLSEHTEVEYLHVEHYISTRTTPLMNRVRHGTGRDLVEAPQYVVYGIEKKLRAYLDDYDRLCPPIATVAGQMNYWPATAKQQQQQQQQGQQQQGQGAGAGAAEALPLNTTVTFDFSTIDVAALCKKIIGGRWQ
jgi:hypothetical protein